jgi:hypothetical protein
MRTSLPGGSILVSFVCVRAVWIPPVTGSPEGTGEASDKSPRGFSMLSDFERGPKPTPQSHLPSNAGSLAMLLAMRLSFIERQRLEPKVSDRHSRLSI